jgi:hypothetical protein
MAGIRSRANIEITSYAGNRKISLGPKSDKAFVEMFESWLKNQIAPNLKRLNQELAEDMRDLLNATGTSVKTRFEGYRTKPSDAGRKMFSDLNNFPKDKQEFKTRPKRGPHLDETPIRFETRSSSGSLRFNAKSGKLTGFPSISLQMTAEALYMNDDNNDLAEPREPRDLPSRYQALGKGLDQYDGSKPGKAGRFDKFYGLEYGTSRMKPASGTYTPFSESIVQTTDTDGLTRPPVSAQSSKPTSKGKKPPGDGIYGYFVFDRIFKDEYAKAMRDIKLNQEASLKDFIASNGK